MRVGRMVRDIFLKRHVRGCMLSRWMQLRDVVDMKQGMVVMMFAFHPDRIMFHAGRKHRFGVR